MENAPHFYAKDRAAWRAWLHEFHDSESAVWLVYDKGPGRKLQWSDIVQEALCYGWIDSRPGKVSETQSKLYISRRKPKSVWSKINKGYIAELLKENCIQPAGLAAIEIAQQNGSWEALDKSDNLVQPPLFAAALAAHPSAALLYDALSDSAKRNLLASFYDAKTDATQQARINKFIAQAQ